MSRSRRSLEPPPAGCGPVEFGQRLEGVLLAYRDLVYEDPRADGLRRNAVNINKVALEKLTNVPRNRISSILSGVGHPPSGREIRALLTPLISGGLEIDVDAWIAANLPAANARTRTSLATASARFPAEYVAHTDGLFVLNEWNRERPLTRALIRAEFVEVQPLQDWIPSATLRRSAASTDRPDRGELVYLTGIGVDHRASVESSQCVLRFSPSTYADVQALLNLRTTGSSSLARADAVIEDGGAHKYLASALPTSFNVNVVPISRDGRVLCVRRSPAVGTAPGAWTPGVLEAMKRSDVGVYELAARALRDELGLDTEHVEDLQLTWLGMYRPVLRGHLIAIARVGVDPNEVLVRARRARDSYEADALSWIGVEEVLRALLPARRAGERDGHPLLRDGGGRLWVDHARLAAVEVWRFSEGLGA